jgi:hypothetical protein
MKSFTALKSMFQTLSTNLSPTNNTLAGILINDIHRQLLLKYFDNERTFTMLTIGPQKLTLTAPLSIGALTGTLASVWPNISCQQLVVMSTTDQRTVFFTQGSAVITWTSPLTAVTTTSISALGVQSYPLPANISKVKNTTITVGQLVFSPAPIMSIQEWTRLNALPYVSSFPNYFYLFNNQLLFWPIPSTSGEIITLNVQVSVADMTYEDYATPGTIASSGIVVGSNAVTGSGTTWNSTGLFPLNTDLTFANIFLTANPPQGDGLPIQVTSFQSNTALTLAKPVVNVPTPTGGGTLLLGQYPLLDSDFHDAIVYGALRTYFNSIVKDADKYQLYNQLFTEREELMKYKLASKSVNVDLGSQPIPRNVNLYLNGIFQSLP